MTHHHHHIGAAEQLAQSVLEFYATTNEGRRKELQNALDRFQEEPESWRLAIELVNSSRPVNVQFYGAKVLYECINRHFDRIAENADNVSALKQFFLHALSVGARSLAHSVLNKLSAGLALFVLKALPDIWPGPLDELILLWANQLELLLRVFAEVAAEFYRLNSISLNQRNGVKTELQSAVGKVVSIVQGVLEEADSSASQRNAAIECVELWLKLPGARLSDYTGVFGTIFASVGNDFPALARILCTIKSNEEFGQMPRMIWKIAQFCALHVCPRVQEELTGLAAQGQPELLLDGMEELAPLLSVLAEFGHDFVGPIVRHVSTNIADAEVAAVYGALCRFFHSVSCLPGTFPVDECLSDLPEPWWCALREELLQPDEGSAWSAGKQRLRDENVQWYLDMLANVFTKLSRAPSQLGRLQNAEQRERFTAYRVARSDVALNAVQLAPERAVQLMACALHAALDAYDPYTAEAVLYMLTEAADFLTVQHLPDVLLPALRKCGPLEHWEARVPALAALDEFARALLALLKGIEHLLHACGEAHAVLPELVHTILSCLQLYSTGSGVDEQALDTLIAVLRHRDTALMFHTDVLDAIIQRCYAHFSREQLPVKSRLLAIRCVGVGLSFKPSEFVLTSLNQILAPRLAELDRLASSASSSAAGEQEEEGRVLFELGVLAQLVATLEPAGTSQPGPSGDHQQSSSSGPARLITEQAMPLFNKLLTNRRPTAKLIAKLCEVLKAIVQSLYTQAAPFLPAMLQFLDAVIEAHPRPACELAKTIFLTFHKSHDAATTPVLFDHLAKWFAHRLAQLEQQQRDCGDEQDEQLVALAYHVVRKFWDGILYGTTLVLDDCSNAVCCFVQSLCRIVAILLSHCRDISLLQETLRLLGTLLKQCASVDNSVLQRAIDEQVTCRLALALFAAVHSELFTGCINLVADTLHQLARRHPAQICATLAALPGGGDEALLNALYRAQAPRSVRLRCAQLHQAALLRSQ